MSESKPKPLFFIVLALVIAGLLLYAFRGFIFPEGSGDGTKGVTIDKSDIMQVDGAEAADANVPTTVSEYSYVAREKLPPVKEKSDYEPLQARTVKFALNVWAGWAPIILQNEGSAAGKLWTTPDGEPFKVELVLIDDPVAMRDCRCSWTSSARTTASTRASINRSTGPMAATAS